MITCSSTRIRFWALVTCFLGTGLARPCLADETIPLKTLEEIKSATVFVRVAANGLRASGSGFMLKAEGTTGYVITNHHVIDTSDLARPGRKEPPPRSTVTVVFNSGTAKERAVPAQVVASDRNRDLAVLRVVNCKDLPKPIDILHPPQPVETMAVFACGFPFGELLAVKRENPAITISKGTVSSIRRDQEGTLTYVQVQGCLNPGNSGGPVVDAQGKLIGIAVAGIPGSGIGLAIPPEALVRMLEGGVGDARFRVSKSLKGVVDVHLEFPLVDPLNRVKSVSVQFGTATEIKRTPTKQKDGTWTPAMGLKRATLNRRGQLATATLKVKESDYRNLVSQVLVTDLSGKTTAGPVLPLKMEEGPVVAEAKRTPANGAGGPQKPAMRAGQPAQPRVPAVPQTGRPVVNSKPKSPESDRQPVLVPAKPAKDGLTMNAVNRSPDKYAGKTVSLPGKMYCGIVFRGELVELQVFNENDARPINLYFTSTRDIATQWTDEVRRSDKPYRVILTGVVRKKDKRFIVEVSRIDLLDGDGKVLKAFQ